MPTPFCLTGGIVLADKGCSCLTESRNNIVGKIFKVHGYGASGNGDCAKAVDGCLDKNIGKAEYGTLNG